jgi:hypothetical protein
MGLKILFALCCSLFAFLPAQAEPETQLTAQAEPSQNIQNLIFYPHKNKFFLSSELQSSATSTGTVSDSSGALSSSVLTFTKIGVSGWYGITNRLRVGAEINQLIEQDNLAVSQSGPTQGIATDAVSRGLSDPNLYLSYRVLENYRSHFFLDANLEVQTSSAPQILPIQNAVTGVSQAGKNRNGGWATVLNVPFYWVLAMNELEFEPQLTHSFGTRQNGTSPKNSKTTDPYWFIDFALKDRVHLTDTFFIQPSIIFYIEHTTVTHTRQTPPVIRYVETPFYVLPELDFGYTPSSWALVEMVVQYFEYNYTTSPTSNNSRLTDNSESIVTLRSSFTF